MLERFVKHMGRDQRGITGLETAIILIAFVVVASVFAYTVLSAGIFSSERGKEAVHAGLSQARGSMELVGNVKGSGVAADELSDADTAWTAAANVTVATEAADRKEGVASNEVSIDGTFNTGLAASYDLTAPADISDHYSVRLWIKSDIQTAAGDLQLVLDEDAGCGSPDETLDIPALDAGTWVRPVLKLANPSVLDQVACVGLNVAEDNGAQVVLLDLVEAPAELTQVHFVVANTLGGEAINLAVTADADDDGLISDEANPDHVVSVIYTDAEQRVTDIAWTKTELGQGDGDDLLEPGEKMQISVAMHAMDPMPVGGTTFTLLLARESDQT